MEAKIDFSFEQEKLIQKKLAEKTPHILKLAFALWTHRAVCELMRKDGRTRRFALTCGEYFNPWGYTP